MEDYDSSGNIRSSMPVQFLATVWTPSVVRSLGPTGRQLGTRAKMPDWFGNDDHDDHAAEHDFRKSFR